jgi:hypothetical protein
MRNPMKIFLLFAITLLAGCSSTHHLARTDKTQALEIAKSEFVRTGHHPEMYQISVVESEKSWAVVFEHVPRFSGGVCIVYVDKTSGKPQMSISD